MSGLDTKRARETAVIYTVLDAQDMSLNRASIWNLARSIQEESEKHRFDPALVLAIIKVESQFDHRAVSPQGARGLMQIQPVAASVVTREMELPKGTIAWTLDDPVFNVKIGTAYLRHLLDMFSDLKLALIAYNWGPTKLKQTLAAKTTVPFAYANKVLLEQRSLEQRWEHHHSFPAAPADRISEVG
jgi:soluble lytic murein transglycosylase